MILDARSRQFPYAVLLDCAEREIVMRKRVYPNRVLAGRMSHAFAKLEIEKMSAIADVLRDLAKGEKLI